MGKIISFVGTKGGIAKSTLALCLAEKMDNTCIVDLDPQGCLWSWYNTRMSNEQITANSKLNIAVEFYGLEELTLERLNRLSDIYGTVIIDCPGESEAGEKTRTALVYSDVVILPVQESEFDINSMLEHLAPILEDAQAANEKGGKIVFLPTFVHPLAKAETVIKKFGGLGIEVLQAVFRTRNVFKRFSADGRVLAEYIRICKSDDRIQGWSAQKDIAEIAEQIKIHLQE